MLEIFKTIQSGMVYSHFALFSRTASLICFTIPSFCLIHLTLLYIHILHRSDSPPMKITCSTLALMMGSAMAGLSPFPIVVDWTLPDDGNRFGSIVDIKVRAEFAATMALPQDAPHPRHGFSLLHLLAFHQNTRSCSARLLSPLFKSLSFLCLRHYTLPGSAVIFRARIAP